MRGRAAVFLALLAPVVAAQPATAKTVSGGTVAIGRGVAGIELGMTRAQVIGELGKPREQGERYMSYGPRRGADTTFDLYLEGVEGRPIRMIGFWGEKFLLRDGTKIFHRRGVIAKLKKQYGSRLKKVYQRRVDIRLYRIKSRFQGRRVWTDFNVDRFGLRGADRRRLHPVPELDGLVLNPGHAASAGVRAEVVGVGEPVAGVV